MHKFLILLFLCSCAHFKSDEKAEIKDDVYAGNISIEAVQNLAYSSYLKACTQVSKLSFEACQKLAKKHGEEIGKMLK